MSDDLTNELLHGMPDEDPAFWSRMDERLALIEAERASRSAPPNTAEAEETAHVIDVRFGEPHSDPRPTRWARSLATAAAAAVIALIVWGAVGQGSDSNRTTVTADDPNASTATTDPTDDAVSPSGEEVLRDALARDVDPIDTAFDPPFELTETDAGRALSATVNLFRDDPEVLSFTVAGTATLDIALSSIEETTVLRIVTPSGRLALDVIAPHTSTIDLDEDGAWSIVIEAVGRSDRFTLNLAVEESG